LGLIYPIRSQLKVWQEKWIIPMAKCNNPHCSTSTGISGHLTFGSGKLDQYGYWSKPCRNCAEDFEFQYPWMGTCHPFKNGKPGPAYDDVVDATIAICQTFADIWKGKAK